MNFSSWLNIYKNFNKQSPYNDGINSIGNNPIHDESSSNEDQLLHTYVPNTFELMDDEYNNNNSITSDNYSTDKDSKTPIMSKMNHTTNITSPAKKTNAAEVEKQLFIERMVSKYGLDKTKWETLDSSIVEEIITEAVYFSPAKKSNIDFYVTCRGCGSKSKRHSDTRKESRGRAFKCPVIRNRNQPLKLDIMKRIYRNQMMTKQNESLEMSSPTISNINNNNNNASKNKIPIGDMKTFSSSNNTSPIPRHPRPNFKVSPNKSGNIFQKRKTRTSPYFQSKHNNTVNHSALRNISARYKRKRQQMQYSVGVGLHEQTNDAVTLIKEGEKEKSDIDTQQQHPISCSPPSPLSDTENETGSTMDCDGDKNSSSNSDSVEILKTVGYGDISSDDDNDSNDSMMTNQCDTREYPCVVEQCNETTTSSPVEKSENTCDGVEKRYSKHYVWMIHFNPDPESNDLERLVDDLVWHNRGIFCNFSFCLRNTVTSGTTTKSMTPRQIYLMVETILPHPLVLERPRDRVCYRFEDCTQINNMIVPKSELDRFTQYHQQVLGNNIFHGGAIFSNNTNTNYWYFPRDIITFRHCILFPIGGSGSVGGGGESYSSHEQYHSFALKRLYNVMCKFMLTWRTYNDNDARATTNSTTNHTTHWFSREQLIREQGNDDQDYEIERFSIPVLKSVYIIDPLDPTTILSDYRSHFVTKYTSSSDYDHSSDIHNNNNNNTLNGCKGRNLIFNLESRWLFKFSSFPQNNSHMATVNTGDNNDSLFNETYLKFVASFPCDSISQQQQQQQQQQEADKWGQKMAQNVWHGVCERFCAENMMERADIEPIFKTLLPPHISFKPTIGQRILSLVSRGFKSNRAK